MRNRLGIVAAGLLMLVASSFSGRAMAQETLSAPKAGDPVVVYTHKFKPADFETGKTLVIEGFGQAMSEHGEDRLTFFLTDEDASEVIAISIFPNGASVEKWRDAMARHEVLEKLEPLRRQPLILQELQLENIHIVDK
jgi:hypothetical protein